MRALVFVAAIAVVGLVSASFGLTMAAGLQQNPDKDIQAKGAIGTVQSIDTASKLVTIKTDAGSVVMVLYTDRTTYKKLAPGETSLTNATDITISDVGDGDRVYARGTVAEDKKSVSALQIILMSILNFVNKKRGVSRLEKICIRCARTLAKQNCILKLRKKCGKKFTKQTQS